MSQPKQVFLHIGHYKTGSSAIQDYLSRHAGLLSGQGFAYPACARPRNNPTNHGHLSLTLGRDHGFAPPPWYREDPSTDAVYDELAAALRRTPEDKVILSSEEFVQLALREDADAALADLRTRLAGHRVTVLFYIREPLSLLKSWFNEVNKGPVATRSFPVFFMNLKEEFLSQRRIWTGFARHFGQANVRVLTYKSVGSAHIAEFLGAIGCPLTPAADLGLVNRAQPLDRLERRRLAKVEADRRDDYTVSRIAPFDRLIRRAARISDDYNEIAARSDLPRPSALTAEAVIDHYCDLIRPLAGTGLLNQKEADNLRDLALRAEGQDLGLARSLMQAAQVIRPDGPLINRKLAEYGARIDQPS